MCVHFTIAWSLLASFNIIQEEECHEDPCKPLLLHEDGAKNVCPCAYTDKSRLKNTRRNGCEDEFTGPLYIRGCAETYSGADGKRLVPAIPAFRVLSAPAGAVQTVSVDVSRDLMSCFYVVVG